METLEHNFNIIKYKNKNLGVTILPTFNCNFRCPYCYQTLTSDTHTPSMSTEVQDSIVRYIDNYVEKEDIESILINWYGGEPLLELKNIVKVSEKINKVAKEKSIPVGYFMVTNGYLLNEL